MPKKNILILYHANCSDGFGAAYAAWMKFGDTAEYIPVAYGTEPTDVTGREVYILDFSFKRDVLLKMAEKAQSLLILDHHKSAQEDLAGLDCAIFDMNRSGAVIAWEYFHPNTAIPYGLKLIQDNDLWQFKYPDTKAYTVALRSFIPVEFEAWHEQMEVLYASRLALRGKDVLHVSDIDIASHMQAMHPIVLGGLEGLACNAPGKHASVLGNELAKISNTFGASYDYDGKLGIWKYSLRSLGDFDVSNIAKMYGGGGHKNSSGFISEVLLGMSEDGKYRGQNQGQLSIPGIKS